MNDSAHSGRTGRYILIGLAAIFAVVLIGFLWMVVLAPHPMDFAGGPHAALSEYHGEDPTGVPAELKGASVIERGQYLARVADCAACHTADGGEPFAGGRAFVLPFGTLYSTNITPDKETGIGNYTDANFLDALHKGIAPGNEKLYPAMPFTSYTYMTDADVGAIKAYLFSLKPVHAPDTENSLSFPFNQRSLMGIWALLFNPDKRFEPLPKRDPQWNRGAYLVEAMAHCGECHTPRNLLQAQNQREKFSGTVQAGWRAYNITSNPKSGIGAWSEADLARYLAMGHADGRGTATGPMAEAVDNSLHYLTQGDIAAMVAYLRSVPAVATADLPEPKTVPASASHAEGVAANVDSRGKAVYAGACAGCHDWTGVSPVIPYATLTGVRSVNDPTAVNVVQVILSGAHRRASESQATMPAFGGAYSDAEIASLANYVTARFGAQPSAVTAQNIATLRAGD
ncbi:MAG TPA: cytochrome c [Steroidobacteraceae bacterium]|jgi:mono/diheme cytochrome c family protein|nr:cytochrome c [Steroidobacteraceae bacterium]